MAKLFPSSLASTPWVKRSLNSPIPFLLPQMGNCTFLSQPNSGLHSYRDYEICKRTLLRSDESAKQKQLSAALPLSKISGPMTLIDASVFFAGNSASSMKIPSTQSQSAKSSSPVTQHPPPTTYPRPITRLKLHSFHPLHKGISRPLIQQLFPRSTQVHWQRTTPRLIYIHTQLLYNAIRCLPCRLWNPLLRHLS